MSPSTSVGRTAPVDSGLVAVMTIARHSLSWCFNGTALGARRRQSPGRRYHGEAMPQTIIDCDVHCTVPSIRALFPYLSEYWIETIEQTGFKGATDNYYPGGAALSARPGSVPESGPPGSSLELLRAQALDAQDVEYAIL